MITLVIATKNRPDFLYRCLVAVSKQTYKNFECIVVGDNCDYAKAVCNVFKFVRYINNNEIKIENVGAVGKNIGIDAAKNNRICYCDDDNVLMPNHIETFIKNKHDYCQTKFIESHFNEATAYFMLNRGLYDIINHKLGKLDALTICHTKDLWKQVGGWKPMHEVGYNEDGYFINELNKVYEVKLIPALTAIYNQHKKTLDIYNELLPTANPIVYPELIKNWI